MDRPRPGIDQAAMAFVADPQGLSRQPDKPSGFVPLGTAQLASLDRQRGFHPLRTAPASSHQDTVAPDQLRKPVRSKRFQEPDTEMMTGERAGSGNPQATPVTRGDLALDGKTPGHPIGEDSPTRGSDKRSGATAGNKGNDATDEIVYKEQDSPADSIAPVHGGGDDEPPHKNRTGGGQERWPNPRGVKFMGPLTSLEETEVETIDDTHARESTIALRTVLRESQAAGIEIIDTSGMKPGDRIIPAQTDETYDTMAFPEFSITHELELAERLSSQGELNVPQVQYFLDMSHDDMTEMLEVEGGFILERIDMDRGEGKYLIDRTDQIDTLSLLIEDDRYREVIDKLVVKEFIPTPTDRYTSLKVYTDPKADSIAASLIYSSHTKDEAGHRVLRMPNPTEHSDPTRVLFEYPESVGYLGAKDPVSLSEGGFGQIALMGPYAGILQPGEAEILAAHGIDPAHPAVPGELLTQVKELKPLTRFAGLVSSNDFVVNAYTLDPFYLETNSQPGPSPVGVCWLGSPNHPDRYLEMYRRTVRSLVGV